MDFPALFRHTFEPKLLEEIEAKASRLSLHAGDVIIDAGQTIRHVPIILKGSVKVTRTDEEGHELLLYYINPMESCAMTFTCCMMQSKSEVRAVADDEVELLALPVGIMDEWIARYPTWKSYIMKTIRSRFNELLKTIDQIAFQHLDQRLIHYLKEKAKATGSALINLSHQQIADELATSRVVISRLLKKLENDNKVLLFRNQVKLREL